jgi:hypothetical protein
VLTIKVKVGGETLVGNGFQAFCVYVLVPGDKGLLCCNYSPVSA